MKRRAWLLSAAGGAGALVVGWCLLPARSRLGSAAKPWPASGEPDLTGVVFNGWIKIRADGGVVLAMPRSEMGQGVHTALPMLVAEELDVPLSMVRVVQAPLDKIFGNIAMLQDGLPFHPDDTGRLKTAVSWIVGKVARWILFVRCWQLRWE